MGVLDDAFAEHVAAKKPAAPASTSPLDQVFEEHTGHRTAKKQTMWDRLRGHLPSRKQVADFARPILEGTGAAVGATIGAAAGGATGGVTVPLVGAIPGAAVGGVSGAGLGFATGKQVADMFEGPSATGVRTAPGVYRPRTAGEEVKNTLGNVKQGAIYEMGGQVGGMVAGKVVNSVKNSLAMGVPGSKTRNMFRAAQEFGDAESGVKGDWKTTDEGFAQRGEPTDAARQAHGKAARVQRDQKVLDRLNETRKAKGLPPMQMSAGQKQGGALLALEQKQRLQYKTKPATRGSITFDDRVTLNNAVIADAARTEMEKSIPKGKPVPSTEDPMTTGGRIVKAIRESEAAVKPEVKRLFDHPSFNYEMPRAEFDTAVETTMKGNLTRDSKKAVQDVVTFSKSAPKTAAGLKSIKETIDSEIGKAATKGDKSTVRVLGQLKQGIMDSFEAMGKAAESGDVAIHEGKIVYPSKLKAQLADVEGKLAAETERLAATKPGASVKALQDALKAGGAPPNIWMKQVNEQAGQYEARLTKDFQRLNPGKPIPAAEGAIDRSALERLTAQRNTLTNTIAGLKPAEDVATAYSSALKYTKEEQKDRFARATIKGILKTGDQYGGLNTPLNQIPEKVFTPAGAQEFVRSMMPFKAAGVTVDQAARVAAGRKAAGELAFPHMVRQFTKAAIDPKTGVMQIPAAMKYLQDNKDVLRTLGLTKDAEQMIKGQVRAAIDHNLSLRGVDALNNPTMTARLAKKFVKEQFGPAVQKFFGSTRAMDDWARTLEIAERSNVKATLAGPSIAEKLDLLAIGDKVSMFAAVLGKVGWLVNSMKGAVGTLSKQPMELSRAAKDQIIQNGLMDEEVAKSLREIYRAKKFTDISQKAADTLKQLIVQMEIDPNGAASAAGLGVQAVAGTAGLVGSGLNALVPQPTQPASGDQQ